MGKILITGGAGFIGSHISKLLIRNKKEIRILDDLSTGRKENIPKKAEFIKGDIREEKKIKKAIKGVTKIIHLAAMVSVPKSTKKPKKCMEINYQGTKKLLKQSKAEGIKKVIIASSAAVYGENGVKKQKESSPKKPSSPYAKSKLKIEKLAKNYSEKGLKTVCPRFFNVYGPGQRVESGYAAAIPAFIKRAKNNQKIIIYGDGEQTRDFIYVKDIAKCLKLLLKKGEGNYNIATGEPTTINRLAKYIRGITGSNSKIVHEEERPGDIKHSTADTTKAEKELGFIPPTKLEQGLKETIQEF